jgi:hypothetical protein
MNSLYHSSASLPLATENEDPEIKAKGDKLATDWETRKIQGTDAERRAYINFNSYPIAITEAHYAKQ